MSDAREIVQPRWKRRATEIAEAIGGNSTGVSSVSLDLNTITLLSEAIANEIALKTLDINIEKYSGVDYGTAGMPMQQGYSAVTGNRLPFHVDQQGNVDVNVKQFNDVDVDTRGLPVQAGRTTTTNTLVPLIVNCPTVNNFPSGGGGTGGGLNITDTTTAFKNALYGSGVAAANANMIHSVEVGTSNAINTTLRNPNFPLAVDITNSSLNVTGASVTFPSTMAVTLPVDANNVTIPLATTETAPVTTVSVDNHPTSTTITGTVSVTETNPVSGGGGGGGTSLTQQQVETAMGNALANATGISVTESAPVTAVTATIVGDDTYGIIMSKNYYGVSNNQNDDYSCQGLGLGAYAGYDAIQGVQGAVGGVPVTTEGWTIRCNGVDIPNQDISNGLRGTTPTPTPIQAGVSTPSYSSSASSHPLLILIDSQEIVDKYHGRKVTLSSVANVWIVEPEIQPEHHGPETGYVVDRKNPSSAGYATEKNFTIETNQGTYYYQRVYDGGFLGYTTANAAKYYGSRVVRLFGPSGYTDSWSFIDNPLT